MTGVFAILIPVALGAVALTLFVGVFAMFRGGQFNRDWSNRLMRLRVALQFGAILIIVAAVAVSGHRHG